MSQIKFDTETRRAVREAINCPSRMWSATLAPTAAEIVNISPHGCMVHCDQSLPMGEYLTVDVPSVGALRGVVIWALDARIGVEFDAPIALENYLTMLDSLLPAADQPQSG